MRRAVNHALHRYVGEQEQAVTPGAAVIVEWGGRTLVREARGLAQRHDCGRSVRRPLDLVTRFDLASITKVLVTTSALMRLVGDSRIDLAATVREYVPGFCGGNKSQVTLAHLLAHEAGLPPWAPVYLHASEPDAALEWAASRPLSTRPGSAHAYSDLGFLLLGAVLEAAAGLPLDEAAEREVVGPLGLGATGYRPRRPAPDGPSGAPRRPAIDGPFAATSCGDGHERQMVATGRPYPVAGDPDAFSGWRDHTLVGEVNDGNAWHAMAGVAGHAGAFGTVDDVARLGRALLAGTLGRDNPLAPPPVVTRFVRPTRWGRQALGWWRDPGDARLGGRLVGHSGFTGGRLAVDPSSESLLVLLANRQQLGPPHPDVTPLWRALTAALPAQPPR